MLDPSIKIKKRIGRKHSEETKLKMSLKAKGRIKSPEEIQKIRLANIGKIPWNKGKTMPDYIKDKQRGEKNHRFGKPAWNRGTKGIMVPWNKGLKHNQESIEKMRIAKLGSKNPRFGKKNSPESNEKNRISNTGKSIGMKGKRHKPETIIKMKEKRKTWSTPYKDTKIELKMQELLSALHIPFRKHFPVYHKQFGYHQVDIMILDHEENPKIAIECDGCYWHGCPEHHPEITSKKDKDRRIDEYLPELGIKVIRFWEHDINQNKIDIEVFR